MRASELVLSALIILPAVAQPQIIQIYRDRLKPGVEAAYTKIEEEAARTCAQLKAPNPYLALRSLNGPDEVWFLNFYDSDAAVARVKDEYGKKINLLAELNRVSEGKKDLVLAPQESWGYLQEDIGGGAAVDLKQIRYFSFTTTTFDPDHLKYSDLAATGWIFRMASEAAMLVVTPLAARPATIGPNTRLFEVKPTMSLLPK